MKANGDIPWIIFSGVNNDLKALLEQDITEEIKIKIWNAIFSR